MKLRCIAVITLALAGGCAGQRPSPADAESLPEATIILTPSRLSKVASQASPPDFGGRIRVLNLDHWSEAAYDSPRYFLLSDSNDQHWIWKINGTTGRATWYGPLSTESLSSLIEISPSSARTHPRSARYV